MANINMTARNSSDQVESIYSLLEMFCSKWPVEHPSEILPIGRRILRTRTHAHTQRDTDTHSFPLHYGFMVDVTEIIECLLSM
jgi:hypothetical protein